MNERRKFLVSSAGAAAAALAGPAFTRTSKPVNDGAKVVGSEHWTTKKTAAGDVRLFLWRKRSEGASRGTVLFVHGSSVSATPAYDLQIPGRPEASVMDWFARLGYDTWCVDCEGYGRSDKWRSVNADVACGADDLEVASDYVIRETKQKLLVYGSSSGALRAALFAQRHPDPISRLAVSGFVWTGEGSPTLAERRKRLPQYLASNRRPIDRAFIHGIFTRDRSQTSDAREIDAFADAVLALDTSMPTGTYVDMSANLPLVDPEKIAVPMFIMRGQFDGIATLQDLVSFYVKLSNPDKQFSVMPGVAHSSFRSKNWRMVYHLLDGYFSRPAPLYTG